MSWKNRGPIMCRTCQANGKETEIYFDKINVTSGGKSIPMEKATKQPHQCQFSPYAQKQKEFVDNRGYGQRQQDNIEGRPDTYKITSPEQHLPPVQEQIRQYVPEPQNYGDYFKALETKLDRIVMTVDMIHDMIAESNPSQKDVAQMRQRIIELEQSLANHEKTFVPANKVVSGDNQTTPYQIEPEALAAKAENEHISRMMRKGEEEEDLEL